MDKFVPLNENKDFRRIYAKGKSYVSSSVITYVSKNRCKQIRVGITTSKKIGNAVQRNRARRLIRESVRHLTEDIKDGYDFVFVPGRTLYQQRMGFCFCCKSKNPFCKMS